MSAAQALLMLTILIPLLVILWVWARRDEGGSMPQTWQPANPDDYKVYDPGCGY